MINNRPGLLENKFWHNFQTRTIGIDFVLNIISRLLFMAPKPPLKNLGVEWSTPVDNSFDIQKVKVGPFWDFYKNTSLSAPGALANRLQRRTARKANEANLDPPN